jgi:hypothetical protein
MGKKNGKTVEPAVNDTNVTSSAEKPKKKPQAQATIS